MKEGFSSGEARWFGADIGVGEAFNTASGHELAPTTLRQQRVLVLPDVDSFAEVGQTHQSAGRSCPRMRGIGAF
jgi:hypothetical protein